jgi:hypothetical protein
MPSTIQRSALALRQRRRSTVRPLALDDLPPGPTWPYAPLRRPRSSVRQCRVARTRPRPSAASSRPSWRMAHVGLVASPIGRQRLRGRASEQSASPTPLSRTGSTTRSRLAVQPLRADSGTSAIAIQWRGCAMPIDRSRRKVEVADAPRLLLRRLESRRRRVTRNVSALHFKRKFCARTSRRRRRPDPRQRSRPSRWDSTIPCRHWCCATESRTGRRR